MGDPRATGLVIAQSISTFGTGIAGLAFTFVSYQLSGSLVIAALVIAVQSIPAVLLMKPAQLISRDWDIRTVNVLVQLAFAAVCLAAAWVIAAGYLSIPFLMVVSMCLGAITALGYPAWNQLIRAVATVGGDSSDDSSRRVMRLNANLVAGGAASGVVGILVGGVLLTVWGPAWLFVVDGLSYLFPAVAVVMLGRVARAPRSQDRPGEIRRATVLLFTDPRLRRIILGAISLNLLAWPFLRLLPEMATQIDPTPMTFSWLMSAFYVGGCLTPLASARWSKQWGYEGLFGAALATMAVALLLVCASAFLGTGTVHLALLAVVLVPLGLSFHLSLTIMNASIQTAAPPDQEDGLLAGYSAVVTVSYPIGGLMMAAIGGHLGAWWAAAIEMVGLALLSLLVWERLGAQLREYSAADPQHRRLLHHGFAGAHGHMATGTGDVWVAPHKHSAQ